MSCRCDRHGNGVPTVQLRCRYNINDNADTNTVTPLPEGFRRLNCYVT